MISEPISNPLESVDGRKVPRVRQAVIEDETSLERCKDRSFEVQQIECVASTQVESLEDA